jgi:hypothetical protein
MGAQKYMIRKGYYVERWYLNPNYNKSDIPKGTAFYGAAAEKIKNRFTIKYYICDFKIGHTVEIPREDMRKVRRKDYKYIKTIDNKFIKSTSPGGLYTLPVVPIKKCYANGWCKLYPTHYNKDLYIKRSTIY